MQSPIELTTRTIYFRPDLEIMVVRWHTHGSMEVVQADYACMLEAAEAFGASDWLLDVRRREKVTAELSAWCNDTFYPQAARRLAPRRLRLAVLSSPALTEAYRNDPNLKKYVEQALAPKQTFDTRMFDNEGEAMEWLRPDLAS